jgi:hypothetical protein
VEREERVVERTDQVRITGTRTRDDRADKGSESRIPNVPVIVESGRIRSERKANRGAAHRKARRNGGEPGEYGTARQGGRRRRHGNLLCVA